MKVLLIITGLSVGGAERVVINLADALADRGHEVIIAFLTGNAVVLPLNVSVKVFSVGMNTGKNIVVAYLKLRSLVLKFKPDVVHSHMVHANILSRLLRCSVSIPRLICTAHSNNEGGIFRMLAYRLTDFLADISTNVSNDAVETFIKKRAVKRGRMISVPNGVNTNNFTFDCLARIHTREDLNIEQRFMFLAVGRLEAAKNYPNLLQAVAILKEIRTDFQVFIVGDGVLKDELLQLVNALGISQYVEFLGVRRDIPDLLSAADCFVLSSEWEGFGLVVAEAMACERVVIATDCGGVKEVLGFTGNLIRKRDPDMLASKMNDVLTLTVEQRVTLGGQARARIKEFYSLDASVDKYIELYS